MDCTGLHVPVICQHCQPSLSGLIQLDPDHDACCLQTCIDMCYASSTLQILEPMARGCHAMWFAENTHMISLNKEWLFKCVSDVCFAGG